MVKIYKNKTLVDFAYDFRMISNDNILFKYPTELNVYNKNHDNDFKMWLDNHQNEYEDALKKLHTIYAEHFTDDLWVMPTKRAYIFTCTIADFLYYKQKFVSKIDRDMVAFNLGSNSLTIRKMYKSQDYARHYYRDLIIDMHEDGSYDISYDIPDGHTFGDLCRFISYIINTKQLNIFDCYQFNPKTRVTMTKALDSVENLLMLDPTKPDSARLFFQYFWDAKSNLEWALRKGGF